ncbi:MAG: MFS transporter [Actinobacteria bacterium]|nr:MFS transporter [Actinomycetota bacterium]
MSRVVTRSTVDDERLPAILRPKDGVVLERETSPGTYEAAGGPFERYTRTVVVTRLDDGRSTVEQTVQFSLALLWFSWIVTPLFRAHLRKLVEPASPPWWAPVDRIDPPAARTLGSLGAMAVVIGYSLFLLPQTITFAAQQFHADKAAQGVALASTRADIVFVILLVALADRRGRHRLLLIATGGSAVLSLAGAFAPSLPWLAATQVGASGFGSAAVVLIAIMAAEAMPRSSRAYSLSLLTVAGSIGSAGVLGLLFIADYSRGSWRILYAIGIVGVPMVIGIGRRLPESPRYLAPHPEAPLTGHGRRLWMLAAAGLLINLFIAPSSEFLNDFLRHERHYDAATISLFVAITSLPGGIGLMVGGRRAETSGRRMVAAIGVLGGVGITVVEFLTPGALMWLASAVSTMFAAAIVPAFGIYGPELFPTGLRGQANAVIQGLSRVGSVAGLVIVGFLADHLGSYGPAMALVAIGPLALIVLILVAFPETANQELEDLNPEDRAEPEAPAE